MEKCKQINDSISSPDLESTEMQSEGAMKQFAESSESIPSSACGGRGDGDVKPQSGSKEIQEVDSRDSISDGSQTVRSGPRMLPAQKAPGSLSAPTEKDLYPTDCKVLAESSGSASMSHHDELLENTGQNRNLSIQHKYKSLASSLSMLPQVSRFIEPIYEAFICPLSKDIMEDPVTVESGVAYEREAIIAWFERFKNSDEIYCPVTGKKLTPRLSSNIALKTIISEWMNRNEAGKIKVAHAALSLAGSERMVIEAIQDLQSICERKEYNKVQVRNSGIIPLLGNFIVYRDRDVRSAALELLCQLAKDDDDAKETIAEAVEMTKVIRLLSSGHQPIRHAALALLLELSKTRLMCEKIGSVTGAILMLVTIKYNSNIDRVVSETAERILKNLEKSGDNIKRMADNGLFEPLVTHLIEGDHEMQTEMANYLGEVVLGHDNKTYVAEKASPALIKMVQSENISIRRAAFKALARISSYHPNCQVLVEAGVIKIMVEAMFTRRNLNETTNSRYEAALVLRNVLESGMEYESLQVSTHGHTLSSGYFVYNLIYMLKNSTPDELNMNLIRILLCLSKSNKVLATIVSVVKETEASYALIELINNPNEELSVAAIKFLTALSPYVGHTLVERLCKTRGQPESLIQCPGERHHVTEKQAESARFLAKLPHQNLTLNLALSSKNTVPKILEAIRWIQGSGTNRSRYANAYFEGLVSVLARFTATLHDPQMLFLAQNHNLTLIFTDLLAKTSSEEAQRISANALKNLSSATTKLSWPPKIKRARTFFGIPRSLSLRSLRKKNISACPIHRGVCSSKNTFCLVDANAVGKLLCCLHSDRPEVVEAALSAISTLLDDRVDVEKSVSMLNEMNLIPQVLNVVKEHKKEGLRQEALWIIEKLLARGNHASGVSHDRLLSALLVNALHHGDGDTRQTAENILRHLNQMPSFSTTFTT